MSESESVPPVTTAILSEDRPVLDHEGTDERAEAVRLRAELDDVESALARLDDGTYGTCQVCGTALADEFLASSPQATACADHRA
ncbi:MAG: hypothetical protein EBX39_09565 [Actinobacteria bacterium]|nr:hypothetical protein [Actinomycetota bacterium]